MKQIDFSFNGGLPLTQNVLNWMQDDHIKSMKGILKSLTDTGFTSPVIISGCIFNPASGGSYSEGWLWHSSELVYFAGGALPGTGHIISIADYTTNVVFEDNNSHAIYKEKKATYAASGHDLQTLVRYAPGIWIDAGTTPTLVANGGGSVTAQTTDVEYNKYMLTGTTLHWHLRLRGVTIAGTVSSIGLSLPANLYNAVLQMKGAVITGGNKSIGLYNSTPTLIQTLGGAYGAAALRVVELSVSGGGNFTAGTNDQNFDIQIVCELAF